MKFWIFVILACCATFGHAERRPDMSPEKYRTIQVNGFIASIESLMVVDTHRITDDQRAEFDKEFRKVIVLSKGKPDLIAAIKSYYSKALTLVDALAAVHADIVEAPRVYRPQIAELEQAKKTVEIELMAP